VTSRAWNNKLSISGATRGNTIAINPFKQEGLLLRFANVVCRSDDEGESWAGLVTMPNGGATPKTNAFIVSPKDSNYWVAAYGLPDRIVWTDDAGAHWHDALVHDFGGVRGSARDRSGSSRHDVLRGESSATTAGTVLNPLWRSTDRGKTWSIFSDSLFRSPCDILRCRRATAR
jgi:photosystem II stability/assembly factor-like uncharacterized protein